MDVFWRNLYWYLQQQFNVFINEKSPENWQRKKAKPLNYSSGNSSLQGLLAYSLNQNTLKGLFQETSELRSVLIYCKWIWTILYDLEWVSFNFSDIYIHIFIQMWMGFVVKKNHIWWRRWWGIRSSGRQQYWDNSGMCVTDGSMDRILRYAIGSHTAKWAGNNN